MRRVVLVSVVFSLVLSLAAPTGAAFAVEEPSGEPPSSELVVADEALVDPQNETIQEPPVKVVEMPSLMNEVELEAAPELAAPSLPDVPVVIPTPPAEEPLPPQRKVFVTALQTTNALGFVELYNSDNKTQSVSSWRFIAEFTDDLPVCEVSLQGYVLPKTKVLLARKNMPLVENALVFDCGEPHRILRQLTLYDGEQVVERLVPPAGDQQLWARKNTTATYLTGQFLQDFKIGDIYTVTDGYWYIPPVEPSIRVLEVYVNPRTCIVPDASIECYDFIKVKNVSDDQPLDLGNYRIRSGYSNAAASASNTFYSSVVLAPGEVRTLTYDQQGDRLAITANDGTIWLEDSEGMVIYALGVTPYVGSDLSVNKGRSWAYNSDTGQWQWATPSPETEANNFTHIEPGKGTVGQPRELAPCGENQYRSEETNRCRTIATVSTLTPCKEGQYRSEETNRCRSIATAAAAALKPCGDGEFRNPETNRCKKIASSDDIALADCGEGRERNPLTNRCRNAVVAGALTDTLPFPVEKTAGTERFAGWWTLSIVMLLGVGYGMWEWREEITGHMSRVFGKLKR